MASSSSSSASSSTLTVDYREHRAWPLTSATTCYSGARSLRLCRPANAAGTRRGRDRETAVEEVSADVVDEEDEEEEVVVVATETHSLALRWHRPQNKHDDVGGEEPHNDDKGATTQDLSDFSSFRNAVCVGYAACGNWRVATFLRQSASVLPSHPTATTAGDAPYISSSQGDPSSTTGHHGSHHARAASSVSEAATMASTATNEEILAADNCGAVTRTQQQQQIHRRSGSWTSLALEAATAATAATSTTGGGGEGGTASSGTAQPLHASFSGLSLVGPDDLHALYASSSPQHLQAELVLWQHRDSDGDGNGDGPDRRNVWKVALDFRPVAPALSVWDNGYDNNDDEGGHNNNHPRVGVWVGSADDRKLRLYCPEFASTPLPISSSPQELVPVDLAAASSSSSTCDESTAPFTASTDESSDAAFTFPSPVLALDALPHYGPKGASGGDPWHCLAAACQDGTVRLVRYCASTGTSSPGPTYANAVTLSHVRTHTLIVDGPIACVGLSRGGRRLDSLLRCVVGSLCGYACEVVWNGGEDDAADGTWDGPYLVAHGLRDVRLGCEDSVLAVGTADVARRANGGVVAHHRLVAVGTHAGRCLVYAAAAASTTTITRRPSSYELVWSCTLPYPVHGVAFGSKGGMLVVTTRRSAHLFRGTLRWWSASTALRRLRAMRNTGHTPSAGDDGVGLGSADPALVSEENDNSNDNEEDDYVLVTSGASSAPERAVTPTAAAEDGPDRPQTPLDVA